MEGMKLEMVKTTLIQLLQFLGSQDRFQLISFNFDAERLTPLKKVSKENKQYFERIISQLSAGGGTFIGSATEIAFK
jgi:cytochrome oxidase Cu insertion factor (SCO1/SenC/PrrC family)